MPKRRVWHRLGLGYFFFLFSVGTLISYDNIQKFRLILSKLNSFHEKFIY